MKPLLFPLLFALSYWQEKAKAEEEREAYLTAFKEKTEAFESYFSEVILNLSKMLT